MSTAVFWSRVVGGFLISWAGPFLFGLCCTFHGWPRAGIAVVAALFVCVHGARESRRLQGDIADVRLGRATLDFYSRHNGDDPAVDAALAAWRRSRVAP